MGMISPVDGSGGGWARRSQFSVISNQSTDNRQPKTDNAPTTETVPTPPSNLQTMFDRVWWFVTGLFAGGVVTVRALRRAPNPVDLKAAAAHTSADLLAFVSRRIRPPRRVIAVRTRT